MKINKYLVWAYNNRGFSDYDREFDRIEDCIEYIIYLKKTYRIDNFCLELINSTQKNLRKTLAYLDCAHTIFIYPSLVAYRQKFQKMKNLFYAGIYALSVNKPFDNQ